MQRLNSAVVAWLLALVLCPAAAAQSISQATLQSTPPPGSALDAVLARGVLRVCTSGDYRPFTFSSDGQNYEGADIEMAALLAASLGVRVEFEKTAWRDLVASMQTAHCDIAMGGISVSLERMRGASYSDPYLTDGKTAITACAMAARFTDLNAIDQPGVRVIANLGGTNQRFVEGHIKHASITIFPDNATVFEEIVAGRADVMITDGSEVRLQVKRHPGILCPVAAEQSFSFGEKAYLLPRADTVWRDYVNQWLHIVEHDGRAAAIERRWLE